MARAVLHSCRLQYMDCSRASWKLIRNVNSRSHATDSSRPAAATIKLNLSLIQAVTS